jgi:hypothetical protein
MNTIFAMTSKTFRPIVLACSSALIAASLATAQTPATPEATPESPTTAPATGDGKSAAPDAKSAAPEGKGRERRPRRPAAQPEMAAAPVSQQESPVAPLLWLEGCWTSNVNHRETREQWLPLRGNLMLGMSQTVVQGKTQDYEYLRLLEKAAGRDAAMKVLDGRYTFFEADLIDPAGEGPMLSSG